LKEYYFLINHTKIDVNIVVKEKTKETVFFFQQ